MIRKTVIPSIIFLLTSIVALAFPLPVLADCSSANDLEQNLMDRYNASVARIRFEGIVDKGTKEYVGWNEQFIYKVQEIQYTILDTVIDPNNFAANHPILQRFVIDQENTDTEAVPIFCTILEETKGNTRLDLINGKEYLVYFIPKEDGTAELYAVAGIAEEKLTENLFNLRVGYSYEEARHYILNKKDEVASAKEFEAKRPIREGQQFFNGLVTTILIGIPLLIVITYYFRNIISFFRRVSRAFAKYCKILLRFVRKSLLRANPLTFLVVLILLFTAVTLINDPGGYQYRELVYYGIYDGRGYNPGEISEAIQAVTEEFEEVADLGTSAIDFKNYIYKYLPTTREIIPGYYIFKDNDHNSILYHTANGRIDAVGILYGEGRWCDYKCKADTRIFSKDQKDYGPIKDYELDWFTGERRDWDFLDMIKYVDSPVFVIGFTSNSLHVGWVELGFIISEDNNFMPDSRALYYWYLDSQN